MALEVAPDAQERRYKKAPFTKAELKRVLGAMDDWHEAINLRHKIVKAKGWAEKPPGLDTFVAAAVEESNLLRRPLIQRGDRVIYSRDEHEIREFLS